MQRMSRSTSMIAGMLLVLSALTACSDDSRPEATRESRPPEPTTSEPTGEPLDIASCVPDGDAHGFLNVDQYRVAVECSEVDFRWPEGKLPYTDNMVDANPQAEETRYQIGLEHISLGGMNMCAWYLTWLGARQGGNAAAQQEALDVMTNVIPDFETQIPAYPNDGRDAGTIRLLEEIAAKAALGDPTGIQRMVDGTCQDAAWITGS